jgi:hypothetical protein
METSTFVRFSEVSNLAWKTIQPEGMSFEARQVSYHIHLKTFVPLTLFPDIKRYDTLSFWELSGNEVLRHLELASQFMAADLWKSIVAVRDSYWPQIADAMNKYQHGILDQGDYSEEQFVLYAKDHANSSSPWPDINYWADVLDGRGHLNQNGRLAFEAVKRYIREDVTFMDKHFSKTDPPYILIDARHAYPALRARPADYKILSQSNFEIYVYAEKWRDRKAGGLRGKSQKGEPIYKLPIKKKLSRALLDFIGTLLGCTVQSLETEGPEVYKTVYDEKLKCYDLKVGEKQCGLLLHGLGSSVDLSAPAFPAENAPELYSGVWDTNPTNGLTVACILKAMLDEGLIVQPRLVIISGDNLATDVDLPPNAFLDQADAFCGFVPGRGCFYPPSLSTDGPDHRLGFNGVSQRQFQTTQYFMRPLLSVINFDIAKPGSCLKFLDYIIEKKLFDENDDLYRRDYIGDFIIKQDVGLHKLIGEMFPDEAKFVESWFITQHVDPKMKMLRVE